jgi:Fe-S oxidoreductase
VWVVDELDDPVKETKVSMCVACGRCTPACPQSTEAHSPRVFVERLLNTEELDRVKVWECLTCSNCTVFCPSSVDFPGFVKSIRAAYKEEAEDMCAHAGILHSLMRLMAYGDFKQDRLGWVTPELEVAKKGDTMLFVGCAPYYDVYFDKWSPINITRSAVRLLNMIGIKPVVFEDEVCCGHDLLWTGDEDAFKKLAAKNKKFIGDVGINRIVFTCPEGYMTFKNNYDLDKNIRVVHITELLLENVDKLEFKGDGKKVSFHDSCRFGRYMGLYDFPRKLLEAIPGLELVELTHNKSRAECCSTACWMNCTTSSKNAQLKTLHDAKKVSDKLVTTCPKCYIHFNCTMDEKEKNPIIDIEDIAVTIANHAIPKPNKNPTEKKGDDSK